jgi:flagella basal body P-ring formation protein FlgA
VSAGAVWRESHVKPVPVVSRGQPVRLRIETGALWIEGPGQAREDGLAGDSIRVLNLTSRREVRGTVTAEGIVRVDH